MKRFTHSQVAATVFVLGWALCPMVFAVERGKQEGKREVRETLTSLVGVEQADSLLDQLGQMDLGNLTWSSRNVFVLERPDGTYVFDGLTRAANGNISGHVTVYDGRLEEVADYRIGHIVISDRNRIDFSTSVTTPDANWIEHGAIIGVQDAPGIVLTSVSVNGDDSRLAVADLRGLDVSDQQTVYAASSIVTAPFSSSLPSLPMLGTQGGVASTTACLVTACVVTIGVMVIAVVIICWFIVPGLGGSCW